MRDLSPGERRPAMRGGKELCTKHAHTYVHVRERFRYVSRSRERDLNVSVKHCCMLTYVDIREHKTTRFYTYADVRERVFPIAERADVRFMLTYVQIRERATMFYVHVRIVIHPHSLG